MAVQRLNEALTPVPEPRSLDALHAWVATASDAVCVLGPQGEILYANDRASLVFGWLPAVLIGRLLSDVCAAAARHPIESALSAVQQLGSASCQLDVVPDGRSGSAAESPSHLEASFSALGDDQYLLVARECRSCRLLALAADPLIVVCPAGRVRFANEAVCHFVGVAQEAIQGANFADLLAPDGMDSSESLLQRPPAGTAWTRSARVLCSGEPVPVQLSLTDLGAGEVLIRFLPSQPASLKGVSAPIEWDGLQIDTNQRRVLQAGEDIHLSRTEFGILAALAREPGRVLTPSELLQEVWGDEYVTEHSLLRTAIWRLRQRLEPDVQAPRYIVTVPGFGYRLGEET